MNIANTATVRALSGQNNRSEVMLSMVYGFKRTAEARRPRRFFCNQRGEPRLRLGEDQVAQAAFDQGEDGLRVETEDDDQRAERVQRESLAPVDVGERGVRRVELAQHHPLDGPQVVRGGDDHAQRRDDGQRLPGHERPEEDREFTDESAQTRQA